MKTFTVKTIFACLLLVLASCSDADSTGNSATTTNKTTFKLNGVLITADETKATHYTNTVEGGKYIDVFAYKGGKQILELHFPATAGTYPAQQSFNMTTSWLTYIANGGTDYSADFYNSTSGSITLTTLDLTGNKIRGTFNFVGNNTSVNATITEGILVVDQITNQ